MKLGIAKTSLIGEVHLNWAGVVTVSKPSVHPVLRFRPRGNAFVPYPKLDGRQSGRPGVSEEKRRSSRRTSFIETTHNERLNTRSG